jgi:hypothetical protein
MVAFAAVVCRWWNDERMGKARAYIGRFGNVSLMDFMF